jgi:hypothetical protein
MTTTNLDKAKLKRGDSYTLQVVITSGGTLAPTDVLEWQAKRKVSDPSPAIAKSSTTGGVVWISPTTAEVRLSPADTSGFEKSTLLYWEFQRKSADGSVVDTLILQTGESRGELTIEPDYLRP